MAIQNTQTVSFGWRSSQLRLNGCFKQQGKKSALGPEQTLSANIAAIIHLL